MPETITSSMQGGTPELKVQALDPNREVCGKETPDGPCTRGKGHYGLCGVAPCS